MIENKILSLRDQVFSIHYESFHPEGLLKKINGKYYEMDGNTGEPIFEFIAYQDCDRCGWIIDGICGNNLRVYVV